MNTYGRQHRVNPGWLGLALFFSVSALAQGSFNLGVGLSFGSGSGYGYGMPGYGYPVTGYPSYYYTGTTCASNPMWGGGYMGGGMPGFGMPGYGMGGGFYGGGYMGGGSMLPPPTIAPFHAPAPYIAPHLLYGNAGWGPGFGSYPYPGPGIYGPSCGIPCGAGMRPWPMYPVAGGPAIMGPCGGVVGTCGGGYPMPMMGVPPMGGGMASGGAGGGVASSSGGNVIDARMGYEWQKNDTRDILMGTAFGLSTQTSSVFPIMDSRYTPTFFGPTLYQTGGRDFGFTARPHMP